MSEGSDAAMTTIESSGAAVGAGPARDGAGAAYLDASGQVRVRPGSLTAAGTLRTVMSPMLTRSSTIGATRACPLAVLTRWV